MAEDIFDGISYGKGAQWLNQTFFFFGREVFEVGIASYFQEYAFKNADQDDFLKHMNKAATQINLKGDLVAWSIPCLKTAGCNTIWHEMEESNGKIDRFYAH